MKEFELKGYFKETAYHAEYFENGSLCENGQPRNTTIKYFCDPERREVRVGKIVEPSKCNYEVEIWTKHMCTKSSELHRWPLVEKVFCLK